MKYFKVARVKGVSYLQIWDRTVDGNVLLWHVGNADKVLKFKEVSHNGKRKEEGSD